MAKGKEFETIISVAGKVDASLKKSLNDVTDSLKKMQDAVKKTASVSDKLSIAISDQSDELKAAKREYMNYVLAGEESSAQAKECAQRISQLSGELDENKRKFAAAEAAANRFDQTLDKTDENIKKLGDSLNGALKTGAKAFGALVATGASAATALGVASVSNYADYEQLVGGVETLFKDSDKVVLDYANNAYKTAGLSANSYMETVTSFSASLISSLGGDTAKAAKYADKAISDMSDNANKMGSDMSSIQNAYQGFAKQNYGMLDNLKLGYGGSKEEMERLLKDAEKLSGIEYDISSYSDVVDAIHVIQDEMGITGTTAKEASSTISGSIASTKAAWQNLLTGLADGNADIPTLVQNVVESGLTALKNIVPAAKEVIKNIPLAISEVSPEAGAAVQKIVDVVMAALPALETAISTTFGIIENVISFVSNHTGVIIAAATAIGIVTAAINIYNGVQAIRAAMDAVGATSIWGLVAAHWAQAAAAMAALAPYILIVAAIAAVIAIGVLLVRNWDTVKAKAAELAAWLSATWANIKAAVSAAWNAILATLSAIWASIKAKASEMANNVKTTITNAWSGLKSILTAPFDALKNAINRAKNAVGGLIEKAKSIKIPSINIPGLATGGFTQGLTFAGEAGTEAVISFDPQYRSENIGYWAKAGRMLGVDFSTFSLSGSGSSGGNNYFDMGGVTFAPNITVTGNADKETIMDAIEAEYPEFLDLLEQWWAERGAPAYG